MSARVEERLALLERHMRHLYDRLERVEAQIGAPDAASEPAPAPQPATVEAPVARPAPAPAPAPPPARREPARPRRELDLEELLGGRLLALVGGLAVLLGLAFLVALAIDRGWLDERMRTALAFLGSAALVVVGAWLHERRGATQASLAVVGTGISGLFLSLTAATALYDLVPIGLALGAAFVVGLLGAALAIRWDAKPIGGLGILGALGAPILVGATQEVEALFFLAIAHAAAAGVLVWRRWDWLRLAAAGLVLVQVAGWVLDAEPSVAVAFPVLALFGLLTLAAGLGFELRRPEAEGSEATVAIVIVNALVVGVLGAWVGSGGFEAGTSWVAGGWWLAGLALVHVCGGLALLRARPENRILALLVLGVGLVGANLSFVILVSGVAIPIGWAAAAAALAVPTRLVARRAEIVYGVVGAQLLLAVFHVLAFDAPLDAVVRGGEVSVWPIVAIAAGAFAVARLTPRVEIAWRAAADATAAVAVAYGTAVVLDGVGLAGAWAVEAVAAAALGRRFEHRVASGAGFGFAALAALHALSYDARPEFLVEGPDSLWRAALAVGAVAAASFLVARLTPRAFGGWREVADAGAVAAVAYGTGVLLSGVALAGAWAAEAAVLAELGRRFHNRVAAGGTLGLLGLAAAHALAFEARPDALVYGAAPFWEAAVAVGALAVAAAFAARRSLPVVAHDRAGLEIAAGVAVIYLASVGIVSAFQPGVFDLFAGDLTVREQGQAVLSAFWSLLGVALLWAGLRRDRRPWRLAGFGLLAVAVGKVFLYDMGALDAEYRVLSFVVLGLLLLAGAYAYQRMRRDGKRAAA